MNKPVYIHFSNGSHFAYDGGFDNFIKRIGYLQEAKPSISKIKTKNGVGQ